MTRSVLGALDKGTTLLVHALLTAAVTERHHRRPVRFRRTITVGVPQRTGFIPIACRNTPLTDRAAPQGTRNFSASAGIWWSFAANRAKNSQRPRLTVHHVRPRHRRRISPMAVSPARTS